MAEDRIIKSGQFTLPRLAFLVACGVIFFVIIATGKLALGYILLTLALCVLLTLVMIDYRVHMGAVETTEAAAPQPLEVSDEADSAAAAKDARPRRRTSRPARRRR